MDDEIARYNDYEAHLKAAELRIKHATGSIVAERDGDAWVIAKYEAGKRFVLTKPKWRVANAG